VSPVRVVVALFVMVAIGACASPSRPPEPIVLDGTSWRAVAVAGRTPVPGAEPTLTFNGNGVSGTDGCNQYGGSVRFEGNGFVADELGGTLMLCEDRIMTTAEPFLAILRSVDRMAIVDGRLMLAGPAGEAVLVPGAAQ
jgi:heat shock protein HslJ